MFENRNGLSSVADRERPGRSLLLERQVHFVGLDVAREPDVPVDRVARKDVQVALRQPFEEARDFRRGHVGGPVRLQLGEAGLVALDQLVAVPLRQVVVGVDVEPPEQLLLPRRERLRADRLDVDERHQAEHLQPLLGADERRRTA